MQLAGELCSEIAPLIDVSDQRITGLNGARGLRLRALGRTAQSSKARGSLLESGSALLQLVEALLIADKAVAITFRERRDRARRVTHAAHVGGGQQQPQISPLSQLVQLDNSRAELGPLGRVARVEPPDLGVCLGELGGERRRFRIDLLQFFRFDLSVELEPTEIPDERAFFGRKPIGFRMQRLKPLGGAARERFRYAAVGLLRCNRNGTQQHTHDARAQT